MLLASTCKKQMYSEIERRTLPAHFRALASPTRLAILRHLAEAGEVTVSDLAEQLRLSQPRTSWHLAMLKRGGLIKQRRDGRLVRCSLDLESIRHQQRVFWDMLQEPRRIGVKT